jgi:pimeloyl-ACP methyl ester carboxylesterase
LLSNLLVQPFAGAAVRAGLAQVFRSSIAPSGWIDAARVSLAARPAALSASAQDVVAAKRRVAAQQARYRQIRRPVAILVGAGDCIVSPTIHALQLALASPNARIDVVQEAGHLPHEASSRRFRKRLDWVLASK